MSADTIPPCGERRESAGSFEQNNKWSHSSLVLFLSEAAVCESRLREWALSQPCRARSTCAGWKPQQLDQFCWSFGRKQTIWCFWTATFVCLFSCKYEHFQTAGGLLLDSFLLRVDWKQAGGWGRHWQLLPFEKYHLYVTKTKSKVPVEFLFIFFICALDYYTWVTHWLHVCRLFHFGSSETRETSESNCVFGLHKRGQYGSLRFWWEILHFTKSFKGQNIFTSSHSIPLCLLPILVFLLLTYYACVCICVKQIYLHRWVNVCVCLGEEMWGFGSREHCLVRSECVWMSVSVLYVLLFKSVFLVLIWKDLPPNEMQHFSERNKGRPRWFHDPSNAQRSCSVS